MILPLYLILIPYGLVLAVFVVFSLFNLFHLVRYGFWNFHSALFVLIYLFISAALLLWTWQVLADTDWSMPLTEIGSTLDFGPENILP